MTHILPHIAIQYIIKQGLIYLKNNPKYLNQIFNYYDDPRFSNFFSGQSEEIKQWFLSSKIKTLASFPLDMENLPLISVQMLSESEDQGKEGIGDIYSGAMAATEFYEEVNNKLHYTLNATIQVSIYANKNDDAVFWITAIVEWILIQWKSDLSILGVQNPFFSNSDHSLSRSYQSENVFARFITINCFTFNEIEQTDLPTLIESIESILSVGNVENSEGDMIFDDETFPL